MVFHHQFTHGRAFHGLEARHMLEMEKRDSHGSHIKLNIPEDDNKLRFIHKGGVLQKDASVETVYSQIYVTEPKTFAGPAEYSTAHGKGTATDAAKSTPTNDAAAEASLSAAQASYNSAKSAANAPQTFSHSNLETNPTQRTRNSLQTTPPQFTGSSAAAVTTSAGIGAAAVGGTPLSNSRGATAVGGTPLSATHSATSNLIAQKSPGMSSGAKAGLAFGIIIAIALAAGLVFFCWRRRKNQLNTEGAEPLVDEKHASTNSFFGGTAAAVGAPAGNMRESTLSDKSLRSSRTASTAPRLSLRPVTQFLPSIMESRKSTGNGLDVPAMSEKPRSAWERHAPSANQPNPFDDAAVLNEKQARPESPPRNPFDEGDGKTSPNHSQKNSWEGSEPPTPKSTKFGTASAVAITSGTAAPAMPRGPNNVHRVQLDFKPSMEDELELRSGQLVRMLHEYDDGWALCIRMDRSQQGVCPRTCLSKLPVKPRPQGPPPPNGPNGRPMGPPPPGMRGPPRPASPQINHGMVPRPLTPTGRERSVTLGRNSPAPSAEFGRPRSQSMSGAGERPLSPSMPARKPVPGQAL